MSEEINTDHFSTMEELLEHLKNWERDDDIDAYYRFFSPNCAFELANKIEKQQKEIEERNKYNITTLPFEKIKVDIEQNKNIFIFGKEYISKDKIREKIKELEEKTKQEKTITFYCNSNDIARTVISNLNELLEEK